MSDLKYLDYEGLAFFKSKLDSLRLSDKADIVDALNSLSLDLGNGKLTILVNGTKIDEFTANQKGNTDIDISVPTTLDDLLNVVEFIKNIIKYGLPNVEDLTDEQKETLHDLTAEESGFVSSDLLEDTLSNYGNAINYDSATQKIQLKHGNNVLSEFSAADFIKDSMILNIEVTDGTGNNLGLKVLLIDFNSDSGILDIEIPISEFFNPDNYYVKSDFANVALSGDYSDLINTPSTLTQQEVNEGSGTTGKLVTAKIIKDTVNTAIYGNGSSDGTVITTNNINEEVLAAGFAKSVQVGNNTPTPADYNGVLFVPEQVLADWNITNTNSKAYINNKPRVYTWAEIQNIIKYGQPDIDNLTDEEKDATENLQSLNTGYVKSDDLATVAFSGSYTDLINTPTIPTSVSELTNDSNYLTLHQDISGKANTSDLATVAFSGLYSDLINPPVIAEYRIVLDENDDNKWYLTKNNTSVSSIEIPELVLSDWSQSDNTKLDFIKNKPDVYTKTEVDNKITASGTFDSTLYYTKTLVDGLIPTVNNGQILFINGAGTQVSNFTANQSTNSTDVTVYSSSEIINLAKYGISNPTPELITIIELNGTQSATLDDINDAIAGLATVARTGSYNDLLNKPALFSGSYNDLTDKPTIPDAQIQSDWNLSDSTQYDFIKNKPTVYTDTEIQNIIKYSVSDITNLTLELILNLLNSSEFALKSDLSSKQDVISDLETIRTNAAAGAAKVSNVLADWNATEGPAVILNKPTLNNGSNYNNVTYTSATPTASSTLTIDGSVNVYKITTSSNISSVSLSAVPENYHSCHVIVKGTASCSVAIGHNVSITIGGTTYTLLCPEAKAYSLSLDSGKYVEFDILRIDNDLFVRGI